MGCKPAKLPTEEELTIERQKSTLESISSSLYQMETEMQEAIQFKKENHSKLQQVLTWKRRFEKKVSRLESILKKLQNGLQSNPENLSEVSSIEAQIEDQYEQLTQVLTSLRALK